MEIEKYSEKDLPEMISIWNEVVEEGEAFPQEDLLDAASGREFFASQTVCCVARDNGKIVGLYILHPNNVGRCGHICNASYAVARKERGRGIGAKLVKDCLSRAARAGFRIMQFNAVVVDNLAAHKLYQNLGFQPLGIVPEGFRNKAGQYKDIKLYFTRLPQKV